MKHSCCDYAVIGGDLRQVYLAGSLARDSFSKVSRDNSGAALPSRVFTYALCANPHKYLTVDSDSVSAAASLSEACSASSCIIGPIPLSKNGDYLNQSFSSEAIFLESDYVFY